MFEVNAEMHLALDVGWSLDWSEINENRHNAATLHRHL